MAPRGFRDWVKPEWLHDDDGVSGIERIPDKRLGAPSNVAPRDTSDGGTISDPSISGVVSGEFLGGEEE